jgi:prolyl-tRNA synthetase
VEQSHDADGLVWPRSIAPFDVHLCVLDPDDATVKEYSEKLYADLARAGYECFMDDRNERPGVKFKDADLLGLPVRVNIGGKGLASGQLEVIVRKGKAKEAVASDAVLGRVTALLKELR